MGFGDVATGAAACWEYLMREQQAEQRVAAYSKHFSAIARFCILNICFNTHSWKPLIMSIVV